MVWMVLLKILFYQLLLIAVIVLILKALLDRQLIDAAIQDIGFLPLAGDLPKADKIEIVTFRPLKPETQKKISQAVCKKFNKELPVETRQDKKIRGGIFIRIGPVHIDFTLHSRLKTIGLAK